MKLLTNNCDGQLNILQQIVKDLQASEDRNDNFMKELLERAVNLEVSKVSLSKYQNDKAKLEARLNAFDRYNKENHTHYV